MLIIYLSDAVEYLRHTVPKLGLESQGTQEQARVLVTEQTLVQNVPPQLEIVLMTAQPVSVDMRSSVRRETHTSTWWEKQETHRRRDTSFTKYLMRRWSTHVAAGSFLHAAGATLDILVSLSRKKSSLSEKEKNILYNYKRHHLTQWPNYSSISRVEILNIFI